MDTNAVAALTAVQLDGREQQEQWFGAILQVCEQIEEPTWDHFVTALPGYSEAAGLGRDVADQFIEYMNNNVAAPMDTVLELVRYGDSLPDLHAQLVAETVAPAGGGYDEAAWQAVSTEEAEPTPDVSTFPQIQEGDTGEWVEYLDAMLTSKGF
jgi:hypothetical protein